MTEIFAFDKIFSEMRFNKIQRKELAKTLFNAANLILAIVILTPIVSKEKFGFLSLLGGFFWLIFIISATILLKGVE
ncbi:MAG: hypothetical protein ABIJ15_06340 [bacterium]